MEHCNVVVLGAGPAGISAAYHIKKAGHNPIVYEQNPYTGGLCHSYQINGFTFDTFVHLSFSKSDYVNGLFNKSCTVLQHFPESWNYWNDIWVRHPAQNNLYHLPTKTKVKVVEALAANNNTRDAKNYEQWLRYQFGDYFAEKFPMKYTRKYWCCEASELETKWIGARISKPDITQILYGAFQENRENNYYTSEMRYPLSGGFQSFLTEMEKDLCIYKGKKVVRIDPSEKKIFFLDGDQVSYNSVISTLPLSEISRLVPSDEAVADACGRLNWTGGVTVSVMVKGSLKFSFERKGNNFPLALWLYVYDEHIPFSRIYIASRKSLNNAPEGCSSLQAEIYFPGRTGFSGNVSVLSDIVVDYLCKMRIIDRDDLLFTDARINNYANVVFDHNIYSARQYLLDFLLSKQIISAGRFGEWDYFWSDQSILSGKKAAEKIIAFR